MSSLNYNGMVVLDMKEDFLLICRENFLSDTGEYLVIYLGGNKSEYSVGGLSGPWKADEIERNLSRGAWAVQFNLDEVFNPKLLEIVNED